jgi:hypothetical protein
MKQTAVMSLLKEIYGENWSTNLVFQDFANKYLEMEKEQIIKAHSAGFNSGYGWRDKETGNEYYEKTYGKKE